MSYEGEGMGIGAHARAHVCTRIAIAYGKHGRMERRENRFNERGEKSNYTVRTTVRFGYHPRTQLLTVLQSPMRGAYVCLACEYQFRGKKSCSYRQGDNERNSN